MFILSEFTDVVKIKPTAFGRDINESIRDALNEKLSNKVIPDIGLCITLFDILHIGDSVILPGDPNHHTHVRYRFVVFRPFQNEIVIGKIKRCTEEGVQVSLGFFDDILIPEQHLAIPSKFSEVDQLWYWEYNDEGIQHTFVMELDKPIKLRIVSEIFAEATQDSNDRSSKAPFTLIGSINEIGLGILDWWQGK